MMRGIGKAHPLTPVEGRMKHPETRGDETSRPQEPPPNCMTVGKSPAFLSLGFPICREGLFEG